MLPVGYYGEHDLSHPLINELHKRGFCEIIESIPELTVQNSITVEGLSKSSRPKVWIINTQQPNWEIFAQFTIKSGSNLFFSDLSVISPSRFYEFEKLASEAEISLFGPVSITTDIAIKNPAMSPPYALDLCLNRGDSIGVKSFLITELLVTASLLSHSPVRKIYASKQLLQMDIAYSSLQFECENGCCGSLRLINQSPSSKLDISLWKSTVESYNTSIPLLSEATRAANCFEQFCNSFLLIDKSTIQPTQLMHHWFYHRELINQKF